MINLLFGALLGFVVASLISGRTDKDKETPGTQLFKGKGLPGVIGDLNAYSLAVALATPIVVAVLFQIDVNSSLTYDLGRTLVVYAIAVGVVYYIVQRILKLFPDGQTVNSVLFANKEADKKPAAAPRRKSRVSLKSPPVVDVAGEIVDEDE